MGRNSLVGIRITCANEAFSPTAHLHPHLDPSEGTRADEVTRTEILLHLIPPAHIRHTPAIQPANGSFVHDKEWFSDKAPASFPSDFVFRLHTNSSCLRQIVCTNSV